MTVYICSNKSLIMEAKKPTKNIDEYISGFPKNVQTLLQDVRTTIRKAAPQAEEVISYQMPAFKYHGMLVFFAGYKNHIGFYPTSSGIKAFSKELSGYKGAKGSVQFPIDSHMPLSLISKIVKFRVKENLEKANAKAGVTAKPLRK
jgi:uncharacterized protein YdhG (YjbR/CyaY superfamily)